ncbi:hypothetical protein H6F88_05740 [Oculatella sp. FACHB-28]|uniref:hypothetical protein n=1 Tax=Cyanophyceae TaxID=3028117 RepID=UPI0016848E5C|nr:MULTISPECIES: hypothetical protein [Cyanophyceae]MBD1996759.1 hypothetical protein [Leptolyngbya sp. FACHB-541]MBD2055527.1 hypothetical protein [Oculatella sp. FACHB-28]
MPKFLQALEAALDSLGNEAEMRSLLGEKFCYLFTTKQFELARFHDPITEWEKQEYLDVY